MAILTGGTVISEEIGRKLEEPMWQLAKNAGEDGPAIIDTVRRMHKDKGDSSYGYNVLTGEFGSMLEQGVIDPVKVTRSNDGHASNSPGIYAGAVHS